MSKEAVLAVLERAAEDITFYSQLAEDYAKALEDCDLTREERAALAGGDVRWIESHIGRKLDCKSSAGKGTHQADDLQLTQCPHDSFAGILLLIYPCGTQ